MTTTLAEAFAREFAVLHKQMELIYRSAFVDSATDSALDHVAALLDVTRKDAKFAGGRGARSSAARPAPATSPSPVGTLRLDRGGRRSSRPPPRGRCAATSSPWSSRCARSWRAPPAQWRPAPITLVNRPIFGIEAVLNERATFFAAERETDEELRRRIRGRLHRAGRARSTRSGRA